jgi:hypothetical protein
MQQHATAMRIDMNTLIVLLEVSMLKRRGRAGTDRRKLDRLSLAVLTLFSKRSAHAAIKVNNRFIFNYSSSTTRRVNSLVFPLVVI